MRPVLLLVAGTLNDPSVWQEVAAQLQALADVRIAVPVQESIPAMARAAWTVLTDVPEVVPVVLAGFSLGGYVAIEMLARPVRPVQAAALLSTSARPESPEGAAVRAKTVAAMGRDFAKVVDGIVQYGTHEPSPELAARLKAMMLGVGAAVATRQNRATSGRSDHRGALARLDVPMTVLCGLQDRITPPDHARELSTLVPRARLELINGSGHMLPCERPEVVVGALRALLDSVSSPHDGDEPCSSVSFHTS